MNGPDEVPMAKSKTALCLKCNQRRSRQVLSTDQLCPTCRGNTLVISFKPITVDIPEWAAADARRLAASTRPRDRQLLVELLDEIMEQEGWTPPFDTIKVAR
jgi:hypothetical protein